MSRLGALVAAAAALLAVPTVVAAHGLVGRYESPLPLAVYLSGAGLAVALSFALVLLRDVRATPTGAGDSGSFPARSGSASAGWACWRGCGSRSRRCSAAAAMPTSRRCSCGSMAGLGWP